MKAVIQRVSRAAVEVDGSIFSEIGKGFLVLAGFTHGDGQAELEWVVRKIIGLRVFEDDEGKMNRSISEIEGAILVVSQLTLYADIRKGRRPAFVHAAEPRQAEQLYNRFCDMLEAEKIPVERGVFGAKMDIELVNDGPVTIIIER